MNYAAQMKYKLRKELNDLQYGRQSRAVMLRLEVCFVVSFLKKKHLQLYMFVFYFKGLEVQQDGLNLF